MKVAQDQKTILTHADLRQFAAPLIEELTRWKIREGRPARVWGVPRGGIPAAYFIKAHAPVELVDEMACADFLIDDICDSGKTFAELEKYFDAESGIQMRAIIDKRHLPGNVLGWVVFPWEVRLDGKDESITDNFVRILEYVGEDPTRGGLAETPARMAKAWKELCSGYGQDPAKVLKVFEDGGAAYDEMVVVRNVPFHSVCEHHMLPFIGKACVAYIPNGKIVGLSKIHRLVDIFARRLQVQERLTVQIADALAEHLNPKGVGVFLEAEHFCMACRGINKDGVATSTTALRGLLKTDCAARNEFLLTAHKK